MKTIKDHIIIPVMICVIVAYYVGGMFNFFPFFADSLEIRAIGWATLVICTVIAICTYIILDAIEKNNNNTRNRAKRRKNGTKKLFDLKELFVLFYIILHPCCSNVQFDRQWLKH